MPTGVRDSGLSAEDVGDLYQWVGQACETWQTLSKAEQERAVSEFLAEQLLPVLLRGRSATTRSATGAAPRDDA